MGDNEKLVKFLFPKWPKSSIMLYHVVGGGRPKKEDQGKTINEKIIELKRTLALPEFKDIFLRDGKLKPPSDYIYRNLSIALEDLGCRISPKYIYTIILGDRFNVKKEFLAAHHLEVPIEQSFGNNSSINSTSNYTQFRLDLSNIWTSIAPEIVTYKFSEYKRNVRTLRRNAWTHALFEEIYNSTKIPCALNFKSPKVTESGIFITVRATCSECTCEFKGEIANKPQEEEKIFMDCTIYNFDSSIKHSKKRQLKGDLRTAVANKLLSHNILPCIYRRNEAHRLIDFGEEDSPILFENDVIRKAKTEAFDKALGFMSNNIMENILALKYHNDSESAIHGIGLDPLYVHYWTKEQEILYQTFPDKLYFDGSGSVVKCLRLPNGELSSHVYIYQGCIEINDRTAPVCQMISTCQNTVAILHWMLDFIRHVTSGTSAILKTKEIITDFDKALLGACCRAFSQAKSLKDYLCLCFDYIRNKSTMAPSCLLRLDICHYMNMVARWKCYPKHQPRVRNIYLRTMAVLRKQETFDEFETTAEMIFMLASCPTVSKNSLANQALQFLKCKIRDLPDDTEIEESDSSSNSQSKLEEEYNIIQEAELESTNIYSWAQQTFKTCMEKIEKEPEHEEINAYYLPDFAKNLLALLPWFPIFSEVMRYLCNCGTKDVTSAPVESEINDIKNRKFKNVQLPLRADKFVAFHLKALRAHLAEIAAGNIQLTETGKYVPVEKPNEKRKNVPTLENEDLNEEHNWRNKNKTRRLNAIVKNENTSTRNERGTSSQEDTDRKNSYVALNTENRPAVTENLHGLSDISSINIFSIANSATNDDNLFSICGFDPVEDLRRTRKRREEIKKKTRKFRYGDPFPQFDPSLKEHLSLPVLTNANKCGNVKDKGTIFVIKNTCAFDTLCQIVSLAILNYEAYNKATATIDSGIFKCAKLLISEGLKVAVYKQRAATLKDVTALHTETIEHKKSNNKKITIIKIDGSFNIASLASLIFSENPSSTVHGQCSKCKKKHYEDTIVLLPNYNVLQIQGLLPLNKTLESVRLPPITCCGITLKSKVHYGPHVLIEVGLGKSQSVELCSIATTITLANDEYRLVGLVAYEGMYQTDYVGHYVAFVNSAHHWVQYDDLLSKPTVVAHNCKVDPQLLIFVKIKQ